MEKLYNIRISVLDMPMEMWNRFHEVYGDGDFETTTSHFLKQVGLPGGLSSRYNEEEKRFFESIYALERTFRK